MTTLTTTMSSTTTTSRTTRRAASSCGSTTSTIRSRTCCGARSASRAACRTAATRRSSSTSNTRARRIRRSTSRCAASGRCGTSSQACIAARSLPICMSEALGLGVIPPTVLRDGPLGEGSVQWFVTADHRQHYFTIHEQYPELHDRLRAMALLDIIANNTDRKSGHCLLVPADRRRRRHRCGASTRASASRRSTSCAR